MKKNIFITIAILVIASILCFAAFAETQTIEDADSPVTTPVKAITTSVDSVYCVTVEFGDMNFTYSREWYPDAENGPAYSEGTWESDTNQIVVTNKSNVPVDITFSFSLWTGFENENIEHSFLKGEYDNNEKEWVEDPSEEIDEAYTLETYALENDYVICAFLNLSGETNKLTTTSQQIGVIQVTASVVE